MRVLVRIAQAAAIEQYRVIEQTAVAVGCGLQLLEKVAELLHLIGVDLREFLQLTRIVPVMRQPMMRFGDADFGERSRADFASEHEREDPRDVRLIRQALQIKHQLDMVIEPRRYAKGALQRR